MINFQYLRTTTSKSALALLSKDKAAKFLAGGTNLIDLMKRGVTTPEKLIDINHVPLKQIELKGDTIIIGALASNTAVAEHALIKEKLPLLANALNAGASAQLRNVATVGGNMMQRTRCGYFYDTEMPCNKRQPGSGCGAIGGFNRMHAIFGTSEKCIAVHPSDMCVALIALDATVVLANQKGERKILFKDFHRLAGDTPQLDNNLKTDEMIIRLEIPINNLAKNSHYLKVRDRASYAFALVSVAAALEISDHKITDVRLAMGGVAHKPWRLTASENFLKGKEASTANFELAAKLAMTDAKGFGENDFKLQMAPNSIIEALTLAKSKA
ncbi:xanthine dehydrogenase YagS FAD-binding subunit [Pedobacter psychrotolerans]|uniref:Oxidoreductase n=1 Tax=Pedobacter psychrotolerans TaxID=1843235 RepID=A0A4V2RYW1_9SPHI|nr:xanthine dehydrogenase family protein subunit M [Pedobacter psychrotolerans]TCO22392.1 xanthine dehydrogenase YagS FAD-binding subunit [Pedobacter psychrotolerans]GGE64242.1 oxidoreductase [Pedobacter psychrotolerans]